MWLISCTDTYVCVCVLDITDVCTSTAVYTDWTDIVQGIAWAMNRGSAMFCVLEWHSVNDYPLAGQDPNTISGKTVCDAGRGSQWCLLGQAQG